MTLGIFGAAFLARPIGAILFGHLGDRFGRKRALVLSALLMALAKLVEGLLPTYTTAGYLAPAFFLLARIASGFSLGGEFTGTTVMLFESAHTRRRGLTTSLANMMGRHRRLSCLRLGRIVDDETFARGHGELGLACPLLYRFAHRSGGAHHSPAECRKHPFSK